jgi:HemK-like putative methylase
MYRTETEAWATYTARVIEKNFSSMDDQPSVVGGSFPLRILDLCTGTGCIAMHLHQLLHDSFPGLKILGLDLSPKAFVLAHSNLLHNVQDGRLHPSAKSQIQFLRGNLLDETLRLPSFDILVSNPPYISATGFSNGETSRSVRMYEPRMALVPPQADAEPSSSEDTGGDLFYPRILRLGADVGSRLMAMEVGGLNQAKRIAKLAIETGKWETVEIWRDWVDESDDVAGADVQIEGTRVRIRGEGNGRVVACWRNLPGKICMRSG